jgi:hypothetical protein
VERDRVNPGDEVATVSVFDRVADANSAPRPARLLGAYDLERIKTTPSLVKKWFGVGELITFIGASASYKSTLAAGLAFCIASERPWHGHDVRGGTTVYVAGEGAYGLTLRRSAWLQENRMADLSRFWLLPTAVNLLDPLQVRDLRSDLDIVEPAVIVFDTLARCMPGVEENSAKEMGAVVSVLDSLKERYGATVLAVHHSGWEGTRERGSSALRGAADVTVMVSAESGIVTVRSVKQKDRPDPDEMRLERRIVQLDRRCDEDGFPLTSVVLERAGAVYLTNTQQALLRVLRGAEPAGLTAGEWLQKSAAVTTSERSFYNELDRLKVAGLLQQTSKGKGSRYRTSDAGRQAVTA